MRDRMGLLCVLRFYCNSNFGATRSTGESTCKWRAYIFELKTVTSSLSCCAAQPTHRGTKKKHRQLIGRTRTQQQLRPSGYPVGGCIHFVLRSKPSAGRSCVVLQLSETTSKHETETETRYTSKYRVRSQVPSSLSPPPPPRANMRSANNFSLREINRQVDLRAHERREYTQKI
ncbi:unnamed protein product [Ectocarpus sp. 4 AP-2014]